MTDGARVLLLDDEPRLLESLSDFLDSCGYVVFPTVDSETAIKVLQQGIPRVAVIDVGAHGLKVAREATTRNIPCILISGRPVLFEIGGIGEVLQKPFKYQIVADKIRQCLERYDSGQARRSCQGLSIKEL